MANSSFKRHFDRELSESEIVRLSNDANASRSVKYPVLGDVTVTNPLDPIGVPTFSTTQLRPNLRRVIESMEISPFQQDILSITMNYLDLLYSDSTSTTSRLRSDQIAFAYSLHALNHVLKSRHRILKNNAKLRQRSMDDDGDQFRDQGLTRPKVLILLPFRYMAFNCVKTIIDLLFPDKSDKKAPIMHKKRFFKEFESEEQEDISKPTEPAANSKRPRLERPLDYKETFRGNIDDCFRLGISIGKAGTLKLYSDFYASDIIIASPLGLRMALGAESEKEYDYDFLSSVELLIMDRTDVFLMQNWSHVVHILQHLHKQPRESHGMDFYRVRALNLNGWSKYYRQTLVFTSVTTPEMRTIFNGYCRNYDGRVFASNTKKSRIGSLAQVIVPLPHAFQRFQCDDILVESDKRYEYFLRKVLPQYTDSSMNGTLIYVPSYYDFVRLRNHFKKNVNNDNVSFVQICEYTSDKKVSRARDLFFHGDKHFLLYTERFHFYHRYKIRGIKNLIFYQLPTYGHFYSEMCNAMLDDRHPSDKNKETATLTCAILYSKFDALRLAGVLGQEKACELLNSDKSVHMLVTE